MTRMEKETIFADKVIVKGCGKVMGKYQDVTLDIFKKKKG